MGTYGRFNVVFEKGKNRTAVDENGKAYIDFGSGIGTNCLGFCDDDWVEAICSQAKKIQHTSNYYYTKIQADFAQKLCKMTGYSKVFFGNSGAEANECAIKLARKYSFDKYGKGRHNIITLTNSFHGRTLCTLSATGQDSFHNYFFPFVEGFVFAKANDINDLKEKLDDTVCAVMFEFVQGEGGVVPLEKEFINAIFEECAKRDILTVADEVQTGMGRSGKLLAAEHFGVKPNITTLAKGLAGGVPIGACLADKKCDFVLTSGTHGSTFGGNPISCAGGTAVLNKLSNEKFLSEIENKGKYIKEKLLKIPQVRKVDGLGLMIGIVFEKDGKNAGDIVKSALENGLLLLTAKEKIRLLPPLNITYEEIDTGLEILTHILKEDA
jgi:acetylornithine/N-succinyldiaminopimelate aminotransferase